VTDAEIQAAFDQHKDAVYRFAWRMSGSPAAAEDVTQDV
jgi:DNA-directed RNA polymerase specialized sigma24 family protein